MHRAFLPVLVIVGAALTSPAQAQNSLPPEVLQRVKQASAFVKVSVGPIGQTGSGFVIQTEGETVYLVTNEHVVAKPDLKLPATLPFNLRGRNLAELRKLQLAIQNLSPEVNVVFNSGTPDEQIVRAETLFTDKDRDLAILKVTGLKAVPRPIPLDIDFRPAETTYVFILGFPFGQALSNVKGHPAITVGRGAISSLRRDEKGEDTVVQIDGALNPGNSGGAVVDVEGRLVGVAVATLTGTGIGFAIPPATLQKMLAGQVTAVKAATRSEQDGVHLDFTLTLLDPFHKLRDVAVHCVTKGVRTADPVPQQPLEGSQKIDLAIENGKAVGSWKLTTGGTLPAVVTFQPSYVDGTGKTCYLAAVQHSLVSGIPDAGPLPAGPLGQRPRPFGPRRPPLDAEKHDQILADLKSSESNAIGRGLSQLAGYDPGEGVADIAAALERLLGNDSQPFRLAAAQALGFWGSKANAAGMIKALDDTFDMVRLAVMPILGLWKVEEAAEPIAARLSEVSERLVAKKALIQMGSVAEAAVIKRLTAEDVIVRQEACDILAEIGTVERSVPALKNRSRDSSRQVALKAHDAVRRIESRGPTETAVIAPRAVVVGARKVHQGATAKLSGRTLTGGVFVMGASGPSMGLGVVQTGDATMDFTYVVLVRLPAGNVGRTTFVTRNKTASGQTRAAHAVYLGDESLTIEHAYAAGKQVLESEAFTVQDEKFDPAAGRLFLVDLSKSPAVVTQQKLDLPADFALVRIDDAHLVDLADRTLDDLLNRSAEVREFVKGGK